MGNPLLWLEGILQSPIPKAPALLRHLPAPGFQGQERAQELHEVLRAGHLRRPRWRVTSQDPWEILHGPFIDVNIVI